MVKLVKKTTISGKIVFPIELRYTPTGIAVCMILLEQANGERIACRLWGAAGERMVNRLDLTVGTWLLVSGSMRTEERTTHDKKTIQVDILNIKEWEKTDAS